MKILSALLLALIAVVSHAQDPMIEWQNTIGGNSTDNLNSIRQTTDGGYILGGTSISGISRDKTESSLGSEDYWIVKIDASGNIQWQNTIGGNYDDEFTSVQQTADGGYFVGGYSNSNVSGDKTETNLGYDYWVLKLDAAGNIQWQNTIGATGDQWLRDMEQTLDGGYVLAGQVPGGTSGLVVKLDSSGNIQWQQSIGIIFSVSQTFDGGYILGGIIYPSINGLYDYRVIKMNNAGSILWDKQFGGNGSETLQSIEQTADGGYIIGGQSDSDIWGDKTEDNRGPSNTQDYWVVKIDSAGILQWEKTIGGNSYERLLSTRQTADGGYILGGRSDSDISGDKTENSMSYDYWVVKLDALGTMVWQNNIGGNSYDDLMAMDITDDRGYILGGTSDSGLSGDKTENALGGKDYWVVKLRPSSNKITGKVFADFNSNCIADSSDIGFENSLLRLEPWQSYFTTGDSGKYELWVDTGNYTISLLTQKPYYSVHCPANGNLTVNLTSYGITSSNNDFALRADVYCPLLQVDISAGSLRRCVNTTYTVQYANTGTLPAANAYVKIDFGENLQPQSSSIPWSTVSENVYTFPLGNIGIDELGSFSVTAHLDCNTQLGSTQCITAHIYPDSNCLIPSPSWDKSDVTVSGNCINDSLVCFTIWNNTGAGNMNGPSQWRLFANDSLVQMDSFQLALGDSLVLCHPANGKTFRLEVDQRPNHPRNSRPRLIIEACGSPDNFGFVNNVPQDDADLAVEIFCLQVIGSFDPNDKQVFPAGITTNKYIKPEDELEYLIRFQNTGNDTAFKVVIRDTIQTDVIDIATLTSGARSHSYEFRIYGPGIAEWTFNNILLPDSNVSEPESHGFVKFKAKLLPNITPGTIVTNSAEIYFDYNEPVSTNEVWNTIFDTVFLAPIIISGAIIMENNLPIPGVNVMLSGSATDTVMTAADGRYRFEVEREGSYTITVSKNNDLIPAKGLTTYDVLTIRRHLLGMGDLPSTYKIISAAEVNAAADTSVTTQDIVLIRSLILGNTTRFPVNRLWQFVSSDYLFLDSSHPFPFTKTRTYTNIISNQSNQNFIGIKLGDVNGSWYGN